MDDCRKEDKRIMEIEKKIAVGDQYHMYIKSSLERIEMKLDKYNGVRERIDSIQEWRKYVNGGFAGLFISIIGIFLSIILKR